jgi:EpsI family protein
MNPTNPINPINTRTFYVSLIILLVAAVLVFLISRRGEPVVVETNLENLPMEIADLKAKKDSFSESVYKELNADKHVYRHYRSADGKIIDLYIGYYGTAKGGRTGHNPYACFTGAGWGIVEDGIVKLKAGHGKEPSEINYMLSQKGQAYDVILHWYQSDKDKILATGIQMNIQRFMGRLLHNRNDGAFIRISARTHKEGINETKKRVELFAEKIIALLPRYWPVEQ